MAASVILAESALSFLGLGVQPPAASLGSIISDGQDSLQTAWWVSTIPGLLIASLGVALTRGRRPAGLAGSAHGEREGRRLGVALESSNRDQVLIGRTVSFLGSTRIVRPSPR